MQTNCPGTANSSGWIFSPNYPSQYGNNENCSWLITAISGKIHLTLDYFYTELGYDYVRVYDGDSSSPSKLLGEFSDYVSPSPNNLTSSSTQMYVTFDSDFMATKPGFKLNYVVYTGKSRFPDRFFR